MSDPVLEVLTRAIFGLVCLLTLLDLFRWRDSQHLEIAALFAGLALVIAEQAITATTGVVPPMWLGLASVIALLAQPYLLLRVLAQFRDVPRHQHAIALVALLVSSALFVVFQSSTPPWVAMAIAAAFAYVEGYATVGFIRSAIAQQGVTHRRLLAIAIGSGCLAAAIVVSVTITVAYTRVAQPLLDGLALGSALGYYVGMAPPRWLRKIWQGAEVQQFLFGLAGLSTEQRLRSTLQYIGPAAARATGGVAAIVARGESDGGEVLHVEHSVALGPRDTWGPSLRQQADELHARGALVAPLRAGRRTFGVLVVFLARTSVFVRDDLAVLEVLADQAAMALDSAKLLEDSIRERATLSAVMGSMHEGLLVMDEQEVIRYCNTSASNLLDLPEHTLLESNPQTVLASVGPRLLNMDSILQRWRRAVRNPQARETLEIEFTSPRRSLQAEVFAVDGQQRGLGVVLRDVTAERDLVRMKDELVSVVSHELRTPLASVVGFAELLRTRELPEAQRNQFLTVILEEGRRLTALINDFLDLQRIESGRQDIAPRVVQLPALLDQTLTAAEPDAAHPIEVDVSQNLPAVRADADRIQQVITNLVSNARKYSPAGGPVRVSAREADGQVIVTVCDHGLGLPPEALPRLFEKFFRIDNGDRRSIKGTGLGLAICRKIVEAHGGRIWAESDGVGQGSQFSFTLPVAAARGAAGDVLIVEDDAGFAQLLEAELANRHISSTWASSAEEALERLASEPTKALVLDLLLPGASGEEMLQKIHKQNVQLPIIVVTVKDLDPTERVSLSSLGVQAVLRKQPDVGATAADLIAAALNRQAVVAA